MDATTDTAPSFRVDTSVDGAGKAGATAETGAALDLSTLLSIPQATSETQSPASPVIRDKMDGLQTPTTTNVDRQISIPPMTRNTSSKETSSSEFSSIHGSIGLVEHDIPRDGDMKQRYLLNGSEKQSSSHTAPSSVEAPAGAGSINHEAIPTSLSHPCVLKDSLDSVTPKDLPKKNKRGGRHKKPRILASEDHRGADAAASSKLNRISGEIKSTIKQTMRAPSVDQVSCVAIAELAQVNETPSGNSRDTVGLLHEPNMPLGELNGRVPAAREQALSGVNTHVSQSAAGKKASSLPHKRRPKTPSPKALSNQKIPEDTSNAKTRPPKNQVRERVPQPGGSLGKEPEDLVLRTETGLPRNTDTQQSQASQVQVLEEKTGGSRRPKYVPPLSRIDETATPQRFGTSRTFNEDLKARSNGPNVQPQSKTKAGENLIKNAVDTNRDLLSSNTRQPTTPKDVRRVLIPKSRYKVRRIPIHAEKSLTQTEVQDVQGEPSSRKIPNVPALAPDANKAVVELPVDAMKGKLLPEEEDDNNNNNKVETRKGKPTPSQRNRFKMRSKKEQARAEADCIPGVSTQSGLAQAQPNYSPQPHTTEQPSQNTTITNDNVTMNHDPSSVTRQPISAIGQIQNLLRGMKTNQRNQSRSSSMGRSRGNRSAQGRVVASGDATSTGLNPMPSFGHQTVERRQRGFQPQEMPAAVNHVTPVGHVTADPPKPIPHQCQHRTSAVEGSSAVPVSSPAVQIVTMDASTPEADPVHIEQAPSAPKHQSPRPKPSVRRSATSTTLVASPLAATPDGNTLSASLEHLDWSKSISPNSFSFNNLPRWGLQPTFSSRERRNSTVHPQPALPEMSKDTVPTPAKGLSMQAKLVKSSTLKENENPSVHPRKAETQNPQTLQRRDDGNGTFIPPHLRPPSPRKQLVDAPAHVAALTALVEFEEEDAHLPPHLRRPARKDKPLKAFPVSFVAAEMPQAMPSDNSLKASRVSFVAAGMSQGVPSDNPPKASPVSFVAAEMPQGVLSDKPPKASPVSFVAVGIPQGVLSESNGHLGNQTQRNLSTETEQDCVATPSNLMQGHEDPTSMQMAVTTPCETPPVESILPAVPERAEGRSKAFDNIKPSRKVLEQDNNAFGCASIDSNVAVNDGETKPRTKLQYEPQLHDWEGNWAPAPVEWDARPSFDNTDARHMEAMEDWLDQRAESALNEPIQINTQDPDYLNGDKPAGGLEKLDVPVVDEVSETLLPNDPFTHARIHQTAKDSALAYHKKLYKEKKTSKEDRRAFREATRLHNESYVPPPNPHVPKANIYIRPAVASDMRQITQIYNHYVRNSVVASERVELTEAQWQVRWRDATGENFAFLVAVLKSGKSGNRGGRFRRDNVETIVGFAYAEDFSESGNMYRFTCELQFWVHHQHLRHGIGKTLVDRMINALDNGYYCRQGTDFIADNPIQYEGGGLRTIARILIIIPYDHKDTKELTWQKEWLSQWQFEQVGNLPGIGRKFDKDIDVAHLMKITSVIIPRGS